MTYRGKAQQHLERSKTALRSSDDEHVRYAALELRMAMEALTYDRALAYKDEFPPQEYETWQPRKVMSVLLEIDPTADKNCSLAVGVEEEYGVPAPVMKSLGAEKVLDMSTLREHYDALGSYLHVQSIKQVRAGKPLNFDRMRSRCEEIAAFLVDVLSSPIFNITLGRFSRLDCIECGKPIRRRLPLRDPRRSGNGEVSAECSECCASYTLVAREDGQVEWKPHTREAKCGNSSCDDRINVWYRELEIGKSWDCPSCRGRNVFALGIHHLPKNGRENTSRKTDQRQVANRSLC